MGSCLNDSRKGWEYVKGEAVATSEKCKKVKKREDENKVHRHRYRWLIKYLEEKRRGKCTLSFSHSVIIIIWIKHMTCCHCNKKRPLFLSLELYLHQPPACSFAKMYMFAPLSVSLIIGSHYLHCDAMYLFGIVLDLDSYSVCVVWWRREYT